MSDQTKHREKAREGIWRLGRWAYWAIVLCPRTDDSGDRPGPEPRQALLCRSRGVDCVCRQAAGLPPRSTKRSPWIPLKDVIGHWTRAVRPQYYPGELRLERPDAGDGGLMVVEPPPLFPKTVDWCPEYVHSVSTHVGSGLSTGDVSDLLLGICPDSMLDYRERPRKSGGSGPNPERDRASARKAEPDVQEYARRKDQQETDSFPIGRPLTLDELQRYAAIAMPRAEGGTWYPHVDHAARREALNTAYLNLIERQAYNRRFKSFGAFVIWLRRAGQYFVRRMLDAPDRMIDINPPTAWDEANGREARLKPFSGRDKARPQTNPFAEELLPQTITARLTVLEEQAQGAARRTRFTRAKLECPVCSTEIPLFRKRVCSSCKIWIPAGVELPVDIETVKRTGRTTIATHDTVDWTQVNKERPEPRSWTELEPWLGLRSGPLVAGVAPGGPEYPAAVLNRSLWMQHDRRRRKGDISRNDGYRGYPRLPLKEIFDGYPNFPRTRRKKDDPIPRRIPDEIRDDPTSYVRLHTSPGTMTALNDWLDRRVNEKFARREGARMRVASLTRSKAQAEFIADEDTEVIDYRPARIASRLNELLQREESQNNALVRQWRTDWLAAQQETDHAEARLRWLLGIEDILVGPRGQQAMRIAGWEYELGRRRAEARWDLLGRSAERVFRFIDEDHRRVFDVEGSDVALLEAALGVRDWVQGAQGRTGRPVSPVFGINRDETILPVVAEARKLPPRDAAFFLRRWLIDAGTPRRIPKSVARILDSIEFVNLIEIVHEDGTVTVDKESVV